MVIWEAGGNGPWSSGPSWLGGSPPTSPEEVIIPDGHKVSTDGADSAAGLEVDGASIVNIVSGTSLTIYDFIHGTGTVQLNSTGSDPTLFIHGAVSLVGGGTIKMIGTAGQDFILGVPGTGAVLINVDYTIEGTGTIGGGDGNLTFENFGTVNANDGAPDHQYRQRGRQQRPDGGDRSAARWRSTTASAMSVRSRPTVPGRP